MKKTIKTIRSSISNYVLLAFLIVFSVSCSKEDGKDGAPGIAGNANVETFVFNSPSWNPSGSGLKIDLTGIITDSILKNDVILTYVKFSDIDLVSSIPASVYVNGYRNYAVHFGNSISTDPGPYKLGIVSLEMDGSHTPNANLEPVDWLKLIVIKSSKTKVGS